MTEPIRWMAPLFCLPLIWLCAAAPAPCTQPAPGRVFEANGSLFQGDQPGGGAKLLAKEFAKAKYYRGDFRMCYAWIKDNEQDPTLMILECSREGHPLRQWELSDGNLRYCTEVATIQWLQTEKVFITCRMKPSLDLGLQFELFSGQHQSYQGVAFAPDRNTFQVAYLHDPAPDQKDAPKQVFINERKMIDLPAKSSIEFFWRGTASC